MVAHIVKHLRMIIMWIPFHMIHSWICKIRRGTIIFIIRFKVKLCYSTCILKIPMGNEILTESRRYRYHQQRKQDFYNTYFIEIQFSCHSFGLF